MSMMSLEKMKEAGMAGRGFKVLQTQGDLLWLEHVHTLQDFVVSEEGNISCTSLRCCHVGVKRS